jgi:hypothetical protein
MKVAPSAALCDAIEIAALQADTSLHKTDIYKETGEGLDKEDAKDLIQDAFGVAVRRAAISAGGYPFEATERTINSKPAPHFTPYSFLLLGSALRQGGLTDGDTLAIRFRKHFEDLVCWSFRRAGLVAEVLSEPREERGLPKSIKPALRTLAKRCRERAKLQSEMVTSDDNDLGVDVVAAYTVADEHRSGKPIFLIQCATGPLNNLEAKLPEKINVFPGVWKKGFYAASAVRGGATPEDLLGLEDVFFDRLCKHGWVLDRMRLVRLAHAPGAHHLDPPDGVLSLWNDLWAAIDEFDWRNGWQQNL